MLWGGKASHVSAVKLNTALLYTQHTPALWRLGRLLLLELSSTSIMVGAGLSDTGVLWVVVVSAMMLAVVLLVVVVLVAAEVMGAAVLSTGSVSVASTVSRIISAPPSSDWFSVTCSTKGVLSEWSEEKRNC